MPANNSPPSQKDPTEEQASTLHTRRTSDSHSAQPTKRRKSCTAADEKMQPNLQLNGRILPSAYIDCERTELITVIARMLSSIVSINDARTSLDVKYLNSESLTRFHSRTPPQISIYNYLLRLAHYSSLENCVLIATVYYIDLLTRKYPLFALNSLTVHRFLLTATTIASKALCDSFCSNSHYAKVGGVNIIELNLLEVEFLKWVKYRVVPRDFNYDSYCERKNSTGNIEVNMSNALKFGISTADKILTLYYEKMVGLVGGAGDANSTPSTPEIIKVGHNDELVYVLEGTEEMRRSLSVSSSISDEAALSVDPGPGGEDAPKPSNDAKVNKVSLADGANATDPRPGHTFNTEIKYNNHDMMLVHPHVDRSPNLPTYSSV